MAGSQAGAWERAFGLKIRCRTLLGFRANFKAAFHGKACGYQYLLFGHKLSFQLALVNLPASESFTYLYALIGFAIIIRGIAPCQINACG
jgi:hypothetical protein